MQLVRYHPHDKGLVPVSVIAMMSCISSAGMPNSGNSHPMCLEETRDGIYEAARRSLTALPGLGTVEAGPRFVPSHTRS
jgi:hypothetical protein